MLDHNTQVTTSEQRRRRTKELLVDVPFQTNDMLPPRPHVLPSGSSAILPVTGTNTPSIAVRPKLSKGLSNPRIELSMERIQSSLTRLNNSSQPRTKLSEPDEIAAWVISESDDEPILPEKHKTRTPIPSAPNTLSQQQKSIVMKTINEYCPKDVQNIVFQDIVSQIEEMNTRGYTAPAIDPNESTRLDAREFQLFQQQLQKEKAGDVKKMQYLINFAALGLSWFCQSLELDWIKTRRLPETIRTAVSDGEFDDSLEGIGMYLRGTVFENPVFATTLKFVEKVGQAHHEEIEKLHSDMETAFEKRERDRYQSFSSLNTFRNGKVPQPTAAKLKVPAPTDNSIHKISKSFPKMSMFESKKTTQDVVETPDNPLEDCASDTVEDEDINA